MLKRTNNIFNANVNINDVADTFVTDNSSTTTIDNSTTIAGPTFVTSLPADNSGGNLVILTAAGVGSTYYAWMPDAAGTYGWREVIAVV